MKAVVTRDASTGVIEFAIRLSELVWRLSAMRRLFCSEELANELENKRENEVREILLERFKHIL